MKNNDTNLNDFEQEFINIFGEYYQKRGHPKGVGKLYAILLFKARSPEDGLDQQTLSKMINRSVSTVSRLIQVLIDMGLCNYTEIINESKRLERKYYMKSDLKDIAVQRFQRIIKDNNTLIQSLQMLGQTLDQGKQKYLYDFLINLEQEITSINLLYTQAVIISKDLLK